MHEVLKALLNLLLAMTTSNPQILKEVRVGPIESVLTGLFLSRSIPFCLIIPDNSPVLEISKWANFQSAIFRIKLYFALQNREPSESFYHKQNDPSRHNPRTIYEIVEYARELIYSDKHLGGIVSRFPGQWEDTLIIDEGGRQILEVKTHYVDDFVPFSGAENNEIRPSIFN